MFQEYILSYLYHKGVCLFACFSIDLIFFLFNGMLVEMREQ